MPLGSREQRGQTRDEGETLKVGPLLLEGQQVLLHHLQERSLLRLTSANRPVPRVWAVGVPLPPRRGAVGQPLAEVACGVPSFRAARSLFPPCRPPPYFFFPLFRARNPNWLMRRRTRRALAGASPSSRRDAMAAKSPRLTSFLAIPRPASIMSSFVSLALSFSTLLHVTGTVLRGALRGTVPRASFMSLAPYFGTVLRTSSTSSTVLRVLRPCSSLAATLVAAA
jgi:hypothetical protein